MNVDKKNNFKNVATMKKNLKHKVIVLSENESETVFGGFAPNTEMPVFFDDGKGTLPNLEEPKKPDFKCY